MDKKDTFFILKVFVFWRIFIFIPVFFAGYFFDLQPNFLGGGMHEYLKNPYLWSFANFDGEHYLSIAKLGYGNGQQSFFPLYPIIVSILGNNLWSGLIVSNFLFLVSLFGLYKLILMDYDKKVAKIAILLITLFPGSFFFGSVYTESLFLSLTVWSFYFFRIGNYLMSSVLGGLSSATRVVGLALIPAFSSIVLISKRKIDIKYLWYLILPSGILAYMIYSFNKWQDPIKFFNAASGFGEQRSDHLILLPQVFYRYIFKIIPNLSWEYFPVVFVTLMEFFMALFTVLFLVFTIKKIRLDYWVYTLFIFLIPTLSGSFSSLPRYMLVAFPIYVWIASLMSKHRNFNYLISLVFILLSLIMQMLFVRGYFVS